MADEPKRGLVLNNAADNVTTDALTVTSGLYRVDIVGVAWDSGDISMQWRSRDTTSDWFPVTTTADTNLSLTSISADRSVVIEIPDGVVRFVVANVAGAAADITVSLIDM